MISQEISLASEEKLLSTPQEIYNMLERHLKAEVEQNIPSILETVIENCEYSFAYFPFINYKGFEGATQIYELLYTLFPDFNYELVEFTIGDNGVACLGKISGHLFSANKYLGWIVPPAADMCGYITFKQGNFMKWDHSQKKFAGEKFYLFFKEAEKNIEEQIVHGNFQITLKEFNSMYNEVQTKVKTMNLNPEAIQAVKDLWNEKSPPHFDDIFFPSTKFRVFLNGGKEEVLDIEDAKNFYNEVRSPKIRSVGFSVIGSNGVFLSSYWYLNKNYTYL
jgi:hypothetical protein